MRATRALFIRHGAEATPEGRSLRMLREWLSQAQREQFASKGYFDVVGGNTGNQYRIYTGTSANVCEIDKSGRLREGLCFTTIVDLPIGDVMLAQKIALETCEDEVRALARWFTPRSHHFRQTERRR
ncbi:hypothetical protein AC630_18270 [Bradyrhizobium sp. AS23.2]|nr:hypothetical protein [Bradyrhizobium sp. AS23.2]OKO78932.1 hypothetical protein AC630_18270 [Bradyrhizobium sp. AS23.2]